MKQSTFFLSSVFFSAFAVLSITGGPAQDVIKLEPRPAQAQPLQLRTPETLTGNYLAGRFAQQQKDWDKAYHYMSQALDRTTTDHESDLLDRTFLLAIGNSNIADADRLTPRILANGRNKELAYIVKAVRTARQGAYTDTLDHLNQIDVETFGAYTIPLLRAWAALGAGDPALAVTTLSEAKYATESHYTLHRALIHDVAGNHRAADAAYREALEIGLTADETLLVANFFERRGKITEAQDIYETVRRDRQDSIFALSHDRLSEDGMPKAALASADEGLAFALFSMANLLYERKAFDSAVIYGRLVQYLQPENGPVNIMLGDLMTMNGHYQNALKYYDQISDTAPSGKLAQLRKAEVMEADGQTDQARNLLTSLSQQDTTRLEALTHLGNLHQRSEQYELAVDAYGKAIQTLGEDTDESHWHLFYARGTTYESLGNWDAAEKDLLQALEYQPENPAILNYLGYSWVEKDINLDQAIELIRQAVELRPNDAFIIDSYGWAYYKQGNYDESVYWLERAVGLNPEDTTLNDHLGDAYWQTGRIQEARFQWERAKRYARDPDQKAALQTKLKYGLITPTPASADANQEAALR